MTALSLGLPRLSRPRVRWISALAATAVLALGAALGTGWPGRSPAGDLTTLAPHGAGASLTPRLARLAAARPEQRVEVIVQLDRGVDPAPERALVRRLGGRAGRDLHVINGFAARLAAGAARQLAARPEVRAVSLNAAVRESTLVNFDPSKMATAFNQSVHTSNIWNHQTGGGVGVAVIDTGIAGDLPDFRASQTDSSSRVIASAVVNPNATTASDTYGHGTHVAGLIAGNGGYRESSDPLLGEYAGSAPDANLISIKISDDLGHATVLDAIYGLQFAVDHKDEYNIRVVNLSLDSTAAESYTTDPLDAAAEQAWFKGIVVVAAAGNRGSADDAVSYAPANDPYVITAGAADDQGTKSTTDDVIADWSSRGTTQDGFAKPDALAPGAHIVSTLAPGSEFASLCPSCIKDGDYFQAGGTSMSAPIVSGAAADILATHPTWTPDMVKGAITNTLRTLPGGGRELYAPAAYSAYGEALVSNQGLTPNTLVDPGSGEIDYTRASWSRASWSSATDLLRASWSRASWSCDCSLTDSGTVDPTRASWSRASWSTNWGL
jgi:serine protease AprX